jgi:phenylalanyl-tRNA synthetase beta chain
MQQLLGVAFPTEAIVDAFTRLHLSPILSGDHIEVTVPSYRLDLNLEVDLIEEAARVIGYDKVPVRDEIAIRVQPAEPQRRTIETIRSTLVSSGYFEAVTVSFVADSLAGFFVPPEADAQRPLPRTSATVRKADAGLRPSILPGLLQAVRNNETAGTSGAKVYEIGSTFWNIKGGAGVEERRRVGIVGSADYREVRGVVERLLNRLDAQRPVSIKPADRPGFARGAAGRIEWGSEIVGYIGKIDRAVTEALSLRDIPAAAELDLPPLLAGAQHVPQQMALPKFPAVDRDL